MPLSSNFVRNIGPSLNDESWSERVGRVPSSTGDAATRAYPSTQSPLQARAQRGAYDALNLALKEGFVFAALTGPARSGKTRVFDAVLADASKHSVRCIRINNPDRVPARLAAHIEQVAHEEAGKPENADKHIVLAVDDAHTCSDELMRCLVRISAIRQSGQRIPQVILAGRPELWDRLELEEFAPLARRLAIRVALPADDGDDAWASVEQELSRELVPSPEPRSGGQGQFFAAEADLQQALRWDGPGPHASGLAGPNAAPEPTLYALFPQEAAQPSKPPPRRSRGKIAVCLAATCISLAAGAYVWSWYDWPEFLSDSPALQAQNSPPLPPAHASPATTPTAEQPGQPAPIAPPDVERLTPPAPPVPVVVSPANVLAPSIAAVLEAPLATRIAPAPPSARNGIALTPISSALVATLLRRGGEEAALGDLSAARLLYQRAAEAGSAEAARLTARTYDETFLAPADVTGLADPAAARLWYGRAAALGDAQAATRLKILNGER